MMERTGCGSLLYSKVKKPISHGRSVSKGGLDDTVTKRVKIERLKFHCDAVPQITNSSDQHPTGKS